MSNRLTLYGRQRSWPVLGYYPINSLCLEQLWNTSVRKASLQIRSNIWCTGYEAGALQLHWTLHARIYCCPSRGTEAASCKLIIGRTKYGLNLTIVLYLVRRLRMLGALLSPYVCLLWCLMKHKTTCLSSEFLNGVEVILLKLRRRTWSCISAVPSTTISPQMIIEEKGTRVLSWIKLGLK